MVRHLTALALMTVLAALLAPASSAQGAFTWPHWTRTAAQGDGDFLDADDWSNHVPGGSEYASIDNGGTAAFNEPVPADFRYAVGTLWLGYGNNSKSGYVKHLNGTLSVSALYLSGDEVPGPTADYEAIYTLDGGTLEAGWVSIADTGNNLFRHLSGTAMIAGLSVGTDAYVVRPGAYELGGAGSPHLMAGRMTVGSLGTFSQDSGAADFDYYSLAGTHEFTAGSLQINKGWAHSGTLSFGGATSISIGDALVDLSLGGTFAGGAAASLTTGPKSMVILPAGFDESAAFGGGVAYGNLTHIRGQTMEIFDGQQWEGWGTVADHVVSSGDIDATSGGWLDFIDGVNVGGDAYVNLRAGDLLVEDLTSGITGGEFAADYIYIGRTTPGTFTASGGVTTVNSIWISDEGGGDGSALGTLVVSGDAQLYSEQGIWIGYDGNGVYDQSGGTVETDTFTVGFNYADWADMTLSGGYLKTGPVRIAAEGAGQVCTVTHSGGHWDCTGSSFMNMATLHDTVATYDMSGDAVLDSERLTVTSDGIGTFNQSGNTVHNIASRLDIYGDADAEGRYNMISGELNIDWRIGLYGAALSEFNHTGGTVTVHEVLAGGTSTYYQTVGFGTYNFTGPGTLTADVINVGQYVNGEFIHSAGTCTVNDSLNVGYLRSYYGNLGEGTYDLSGTGEITSEGTSVGYEGVGAFTQSGGTHTINGRLLIGGVAEGIGSYDLSDGDLVTSDAVIGSGGIGELRQTGGTCTVDGRTAIGVFDSGHGTCEIAGGTFSTVDLVIGSDWVEAVSPPQTPEESHGHGTFAVTDTSADVTVSGSISIGQNGSLVAVPGAVIHMTGSTFANASQTPENLAGLADLEFVFEGGLATVDTFEVAGRQPADAGDDPNFKLGALTVGGTLPGNVQLVNQVDNLPGYGPSDVLCVGRLTVGPGSVLDLGGLALYCDEMVIDPSATILGGAPVFVGQVVVSVWDQQQWCYQNTQLATSTVNPLGDNACEVTVAAAGFVQPGAAYTATISDGDADPGQDQFRVGAVTEAGGELTVELHGGWVTDGGAAASTKGAYTVELTIESAHGSTVSGSVELSLRRLGDIDGDGSVGGADKQMLNNRLNGLIDAGVTYRACDLDGDGSVGGSDKIILNNMINGFIPQ